MRAACLLVVLVAAGSPAHGEGDAERLHAAGMRAYEAGQYDEALTAWEASYAHSRVPALLFNIAQAQRLRGQPGDCARAIAVYKRFIELDPTSPQRSTAESHIEALGACPAVSPPAIGSGAALPPPPSDPPPSGSNPGREDRGMSGKRLGAYALGAGGVVFVIGGVYFGAKARSLGDEVTAACANGCDWNSVKAKDEQGRSAQRTQWISYGVGATALVGATILYLLDGRERAASGPVAISVGATQAMATWSATW